MLIIIYFMGWQITQWNRRDYVYFIVAANWQAGAIIPLWLRLNHLFLKTTHYGNCQVEIFPNELSFKSLILLYVGCKTVNWLPRDQSLQKSTALVGSSLTLRLNRLSQGHCSERQNQMVDFRWIFMLFACLFPWSFGGWKGGWHCLAPSFDFFMSSIQWKPCKVINSVSLRVLWAGQLFWGYFFCLSPWWKYSCGRSLRKKLVRDEWYLARFIYILVLLMGYSEGILSTFVHL